MSLEVKTDMGVNWEQTGEKKEEKNSKLMEFIFLTLLLKDLFVDGFPTSKKD